MHAIQRTQNSPSPTPQAGKPYERIKKAFLLLVIIFLLEGIFRKFIFYQFSSALLLVKCLPIIYIYSIYYARHGNPIPAKIAILYYPTVIAFLIICIFQVASIGDPRYFILSIASLINYFLYIPLIFILLKVADEPFVELCIKLILMAFVLNTIFNVIQFSSPRTSFINSGQEIEGQSFGAFRATDETIRPSGIFATATGNVLFVNLVFYLLVANIFNERKINIPLWQTWALWIMIFSAMSISGTRGLILNWAMTLALFSIIFVPLRASAKSLQKMFTLFGALVTTICLSYLLYPRGYDLLLQRFDDASYAESQTFEYGILGRIMRVFYSFTDYINPTPIFGYVIGIASNAAKQLSWVELPPHALSWNGYGSWATETAWADHIVDVGIVFAIPYILLRIVLAWFFFRKSAASHVVSSNSTAAMIFCGTLYTLIYGQITTNNNTGPAIFIYLAIAMATVGARRKVLL
ncbi:MAG: hypothetical protein Q7T87_13380 [Polaromonas sp.]|nr:hypothetical protein [Polaromonas sp.]